ncbi:hypothetical protein [Streptomyces sp. H27-D2]|uniref:hypothetical protein n=1 Tax=Streptomyces sp. H27-D2 TaxID=3046304 RepID=UPI002DBC9BC5|nr:hypothetical protein [Streptomyces sp. H27-D2]MEC4020530.1 hypothetical protein [Streptomyces sp. H27-D2]
MSTSRPTWAEMRTEFWDARAARAARAAEAAEAARAAPTVRENDGARRLWAGLALLLLVPTLIVALICSLLFMPEAGECLMQGEGCTPVPTWMIATTLVVSVASGLTVLLLPRGSSRTVRPPGLRLWLLRTQLWAGGAAAALVFIHGFAPF